MAAAVDRVVQERKAKQTAQDALLEERASQEVKLRQTVDKRTAQLNEALVQTRKAHQRQSQLVAYISHDLRAPLATVVACTQRLAAHTDPEVQRHRTTIERSAQHQLELIDDLVEYARGELDHLELVPVPTYFFEWLGSIVTQAELLASEHGNRFILAADDHLPPVAAFDAKRLRQVLLNLLGNAAKFTENGEIRLDVRTVAGNAGDMKVVEIVFSVEDTGSGIIETDLERVFEPFEQRQSPRGGHGLGLSISRQLVGAMGGELTVSSQAGVGSRFAFRLTLPMADEADVPQPADVFALPDAFGNGKTILVVDDNPATLEYLSEVLASADFDVVRAHDGNEALRLAGEQRFDAWLLDQYLPDMSGWELLQRLHEACTSPVPAILCSAMRPQPPANHPSNIAFVATLLKPVAAERLLQTLKDAFGSRAFRDCFPAKNLPHG